MGYRLYVYEKDKENYDICLGKFYGYADYKYIKASWEYLWPIVKDQFDSPFLDDCEEAYETAHLFSCICDVNAETFRKFIDLYISSRNEWVKSEIVGYPQYDMTHLENIKDLYDSDSDKTLDWR